MILIRVVINAKCKARNFANALKKKLRTNIAQWVELIEK